MRGESKACDTVEAWIAITVRSARLSIPPGERDDLIQDTLTSLLVASAREGFQLNRSFRGFVRKIALARCIDWIRRRRVVLPLHDDWPEADDDPLERLSRKETGERIRRALLDLGGSCRRLIRQRFYERRSYRDIAREMDGPSEGTLRVRLHECLKRLRRLAADFV